MSPVAMVVISSSEIHSGNRRFPAEIMSKEDLVGSECKSRKSGFSDKFWMSLTRFVVLKWMVETIRYAQWTDRARKQEMVVRQVLLTHGGPNLSISSRGSAAESCTTSLSVREKAQLTDCWHPGSTNK